MSVVRSVHIKTGMATDEILTNYDWVNRLYARLFPPWTSQLSDGRYAFYWEPVSIFTAWLSGLFFDRLWMRPAIDFNRVFVFSDYTADLLRADGYPMEKVVTSGQPLLDAVWERMQDSNSQRDLFARLKLAQGTPFLLVNIEPSAEHSYCEWNRHWENFHEVMNAVSRQGVPVIVSLHPLCDAQRYDFAEDKYGVFICRNFKIHDLYPLCGISVSFPCSTNLLAATFKKPLVIYDFFGLTSADADSAFMFALPGAHIATTGAALATIVGKLVAEMSGCVDATPPVHRACSTILKTVLADLARGGIAPVVSDRATASDATARGTAA